MMMMMIMITDITIKLVETGSVISSLIFNWVMEMVSLVMTEYLLARLITAVHSLSYFLLKPSVQLTVCLGIFQFMLTK